ncbi:phage tail protein [Pantoea allii]|uniref:phage tail protein n=1 Tax=Pantoea TaxID=53335 RepID=UPI0011A6E56E|nr:phage tail protein [Pantoea sp. SJZ147]TWD32345.1 phage-related protein [Pantoea sp. SJZ147]
MATDTFTWEVRLQASEQISVATNSAQFGDGYKQVSGRGINDVAESWSLTCNGRKAVIVEVRAFLKTHVASSFWWTNPWGEKKLFRVKADSVNPKFINGDFVEITFTFEQAFGP